MKHIFGWNNIMLWKKLFTSFKTLFVSGSSFDANVYIHFLAFFHTADFYISWEFDDLFNSNIIPHVPFLLLNNCLKSFTWNNLTHRQAEVMLWSTRSCIHHKLRIYDWVNSAPIGYFLVKGYCSALPLLKTDSFYDRCIRCIGNESMNFTLIESKLLVWCNNVQISLKDLILWYTCIIFHMN